MLADWKTLPGTIRLGLASDHGGLEKKNFLVKELNALGHQVTDFGPATLDPEDDYPDFAFPLCTALRDGKIDAGILLCRSGIGMSILANRFHGLRAALAETEQKARASREHNDSNILVTGGDALSSQETLQVVKAWLDTPFSQGDRHIRRLTKLENYSLDETAALRNVDPELSVLIDQEQARQSEGLELIASENFTSPAVRAAQGSILTNKYAEGLPGKRYYNGCANVDQIEQLAIDRAKALFGAEAANVQPHSGSQANQEVYYALLEPGDTVLGMSLDAGGHLSHGLKVNFSGRTYNFVGYGVDRETETINYDELEKLALEVKPKMLLAGASAYPRILDFPRLRQIADKAGCLLMVDMAHIAGLVAAGVHPSPVPYCDVVTTTTHKTLRGPRGGLILCKEQYIKKINSAVFPGTQGGPLEHVIAAKAVCLKEAMTPEFKAYGAQVVKNCQALAAALAKRGFRIVSGGTDNHCMLVDLRPKGVTGRDAADAMDKAGITVNKNMIPFDPAKPAVTSGIRVGTAAVTTRGMKEGEMEKIADFMTRIVENLGNEEVYQQVHQEVKALAADFPLPQFC
ncbi:MAG: serine hydroxymethyltransferase [Oligosphaeraceae bacterium]